MSNPRYTNYLRRILEEMIKSRVPVKKSLQRGLFLAFSYQENKNRLTLSRKSTKADNPIYPSQKEVDIVHALLTVLVDEVFSKVFHISDPYTHHTPARPGQPEIWWGCRTITWHEKAEPSQAVFFPNPANYGG
jgi:hypothetical protein